jgi:hypothetical protein
MRQGGSGMILAFCDRRRVQFQCYQNCPVFISQLEWHTVSAEGPVPKHLHFKGSFSHVIGLQCTYNNYAHVHFDVLGPLLLLPREIVDKSFFLMSVPMPVFYVEGLSWFGLNDRIIMINAKKEFIWASYCYIYSRHRSHLISVVYQKIRSFVCEKLGLDKSKPGRYGFLNRVQGKSRYIANMNEIREWAQVKYKGIIWEHLTSGPHILQNAKVFNSVILFFSVHGAAMVNVIYMQPKSVVCELQTPVSHMMVMFLCRMFGLVEIIGVVRGMSHKEFRVNIVEMPMAKEMIRLGLEFVSKWNATSKVK